MNDAGGRTLRRELGLPGAVLIGLGSILGAGVFVSIGLGAGVAGPAVIPAIGLAAVLAALNGLSSAQLAAAHPVSGGTYEYGYRLLGPDFGFAAGLVFLCAKSASAAAAALGAAGYGAHLLGVEAGAWHGVAGAAAALGVTAMALAGLRRSSAAHAGLVAVTLAALVAFILAGAAALPDADPGRFSPLWPGEALPWSDFLGAAALMFTAFTGYARIATLGEEIRDPGRTIPTAIILTIAVSAALYMLAAVAAIGAVGASALSASTAQEATPLETAARVLSPEWIAPLIAAGAVTAMLGVLLNLLLGLSRVALAMGRRGDLPAPLARLSGKDAPQTAILACGILTAALALTGDFGLVWGFSAFTVLVYYGLTHLAALRLPEAARRQPRAIALAGLAGCLGLAAFAPPGAMLAGSGLLAAGLLARRLSGGFNPPAR